MLFAGLGTASGRVPCIWGRGELAINGRLDSITDKIPIIAGLSENFEKVFFTINGRVANITNKLPIIARLSENLENVFFTPLMQITPFYAQRAEKNTALEETAII